jgi:hypothetical protein
MSLPEGYSWHVIEGYCAAVVKDGDSAEDVANRVAFIEKTARVRVDGPDVRVAVAPDTEPYQSSAGTWWLSVHRGRGGGYDTQAEREAAGVYGFDPESRACIEAALAELTA